MAEELNNLRYKRGGHKAQLTLFEKFLNQISTEKISAETLVVIKQRTNKIESLLDTFSEIQTQIEILSKSEAELLERESFQDNYFSLLAKASIIISDHEANTTASQLTDTLSNNGERIQNRMNIKLPAINLPTFDGTFSAWRSFYDYFTSIIHSNSDLNNIQKLTYLKSSLKGEPFNLVATLETIDSNYILAWELLKKRYDNKRRIITNHVQNILNINSVTRDSAIGLRQFINTIQTQVNCLRALGQKVDEWSAIIIPVLLTKLDQATVKEWEANINNEDNNMVPTNDQFINFLIKKQNTLEAMSKNTNSNETKGKNSSRTFTTSTQACTFCKKDNHNIQNCESYLKLDVANRNKQVTELKLCINCLRRGHVLNNCYSTSTCKTCHKKRHTTLHLYTNLNRTNLNQANSNQTNSNNKSNAMALEQIDQARNCLSVGTHSEVLLSTSLVNIQDSEGNYQTARALLDSASQSNFVSSKLCDELGLHKEKINMNIHGIGNSNFNIRYKTTIKLQSRINNFSVTIVCLVAPTITSQLPSCSFDRNLINVPANLKLADPSFNKSNDIDLLLGAQVFWSLLSIGQIKERDVIFQNTKLVWIISGHLSSSLPTNNLSLVSCITLNELHKSVERFWSTDEFSNDPKSKFTREEHYCENLFEQTTIRDQTGRFVVKLPLKPNVEQLGNSFDVALTRLKSLENRFKRNSEIKTQYSNFMNEYQSLNHMTEIKEIPEGSFFLPHHCVIKDSSTTTKLRVVFDGSCQLDTGLPINELMYSY